MLMFTCLHMAFWNLCMFLLPPLLFIPFLKEALVVFFKQLAKMHYLTSEHTKNILGKKQTAWFSLSIKTWFLCVWKVSVIVSLQFKKDAVEIGMVNRRLTNDQRMNLILYKKRGKKRRLNTWAF